MPEWPGADRKRRIVSEDKNGGWLTAPLPAGEPADIDTSVAHPARVYDYWLGGKDNFAADREAGDRVLAATPGLRDRVRANRAFLVRAVLPGRRGRHPAVPRRRYRNPRGEQHS